MRKKSIYHLSLILAAMCCTLIQYSASAKQVQPDVAKQVANHFYNELCSHAGLTQAQDLVLAYGGDLAGENYPADVLYIYTPVDQIGFVLVSGDDTAQPILGYSLSSAFDPADIPVNMQKWLDQYRNELLYALENELEPSLETANQWEQLYKGTWEYVATENSGAGPLLSTTWNQDGPYNLFCPGGSVTGCVATAMAQVMKYWEHPTKGTGNKSYVEGDYGVLSADFGSTIYYWSSMPNNASTGTPAGKVAMAYAISHCGIAVEMDYSPEGSGAYDHMVENAWKTYFDYDPNLSLQAKIWYTNTEWDSLLHLELDNDRPIYYSGSGTGGGHAFVCDGYSGNYYHFNWGWGGSSDGYFLLTGMTPGSTGAGGGTGGGYNNGQAAILGVQPNPSPSPNLDLSQSFQLNPDPLIAYGANFTASTTVKNYSTNTPFYGKIGLAMYQKSDSSLVGYLDSINVSINPGNTKPVSFTKAMQLLPGEYVAKIVYKPISNTVWTPVDGSIFANNNNFYVGQVNPIGLLGISVSEDHLPQYTPFTVDITLGPTFPDFNGEISVDLYSFDGAYIMQLKKKTNVSIDFIGNTHLTFNCNGLSIDPGQYRIGVRSKKNGQNWELVNPATGINFPLIQLVPPAFLPDGYENNNSVAAAYQLSTNFANGAWQYKTTGTTIHSGTDQDFFRVNLPAGYTYTLSPRLQDSNNSNDGEDYAIDALWSYRINSGSWSQPYDDIVIAPGMNFTVAGGNTLYFFITPYFQGQKGNYAFEIQATRTATSSAMEPLANDAASIYPNPADQETTIQLQDSNTSIQTLSIFSLDGKRLRHFSDVQSHTKQIQTGDLPNGYYRMIVDTEYGTWTGPLLIQH